MTQIVAWVGSNFCRAGEDNLVLRVLEYGANTLLYADFEIRACDLACRLLIWPNAPSYDLTGIEAEP